MQITQNSEPLIVFLLVDGVSMRQPLSGLIPSTTLSINGAPFAPSTATPEEIGEGWYRLRLDASETKVAGPVIVRANAEGAAEWRDILYVVDHATGQPPDNGGGNNENENENKPGSPDVEIGTNVVRNGDFSAGTSEWVWYNGGSQPWEIVEGAAVLTIERASSNVQFYERGIPVVAGSYRLEFQARSNAPRTFLVYLHQHELPRGNLGIRASVDVNETWVQFSETYEITEDEKNARLRFWFAPTAQSGDVFSLKNIRLVRIS